MIYFDRYKEQFFEVHRKSLHALKYIQVMMH